MMPKERKSEGRREEFLIYIYVSACYRLSLRNAYSTCRTKKSKSVDILIFDFIEIEICSINFADYGVT